MSLLRNHNILCFHRRNNGSHCRTRTYVQTLTGRNALPLCQGGGLRDLQFKSYRVCCGDRSKSITYKRQDRNNLGLNRLGLRNEPAPQPQHTLLSSPKKRLKLIKDVGIGGGYVITNNSWKTLRYVRLSQLHAHLSVPLITAFW